MKTPVWSLPNRTLIFPALVFPALIFPALLAACGDKGGGGDSGGTDSDAALAAELFANIEGFKEWGSLPGWEGVVPSEDGTHGPYVQIWGDGETLAALTAGDDVPFGALLVKCGYKDAEGLENVSADGHALTAMTRIEGYDPDHGDWFWARFNMSTGDVDGYAGAESSCYGCHESTDTDGDYVVFDDLDIPVSGADTGAR